MPTRYRSLAVLVTHLRGLYRLPTAHTHDPLRYSVGCPTVTWCHLYAVAVYVRLVVGRTVATHLRVTFTTLPRSTHYTTVRFHLVYTRSLPHYDGLLLLHITTHPGLDYLLFLLILPYTDYLVVQHSWFIGFPAAYTTYLPHTFVDPFTTPAPPPFPTPYYDYVVGSANRPVVVYPVISLTLFIDVLC